MGKPVVSTLFQLLSEFGVSDIVCSPGSRNAALLAECDASGRYHPHVVIDERSAGFIALGIALVSRRPVALICTSGSALLNYGPAVAEAYYQGVPLIVISADRPNEWIDQDDSQTIRQLGTLSNIVKAEYDLDGEREAENYLWYANRIVNEGMLKALKPKQGPVHFNIHLDGIVDNIKKTVFPEARKVSALMPVQNLNLSEINRWAQFISNRKIMLVAGFMQPDHRLQKAVSLLASFPNVCVMAETVSNLHLPQECYMVDTALFPMKKEEEKMLAPDVVISIGGALISRKLKEFIRNNPPTCHIALGFSDNLIDCFKSLTTKIECNPALFLSSLAKRLKRLEPHTPNINSYGELWHLTRCKTKKDIGRIPWCDLKAISIVLNNLPTDTNLFLSNGTSVRYGQIIPYRITHATYSNRGVSGIEGSTSTAVGASAVYEGFTCLITGDMSFLYDLSGLTSGIESEKMRIILIDNGGGDIFRFIPATRNLEIREKYLSAKRDVPFGLLADAFSWIYYYADSEDSLHSSLKEFFSPSPRPAIMHIDTREVDSNSDILTNFLKSR